MAIDDILRDNYKVFEPALNEIRAVHGDAKGYEEGDSIYVASDLSDGERLKVLLHEYAAKLLRKERPGFDHMRDHADVFARGEELEMRYMSKFAREYARLAKN